MKVIHCLAAAWKACGGATSIVYLRIDNRATSKKLAGVRQLRPTLMALFLVCAFSALSFAKSIEVVVNADLLPRISDSLDTYYQDLVASGYAPTVYPYDPDSGTTRDLKGHLQSRWASGSLDGTVFIGDLPVATYEMHDDFGGRYSAFPSDLYYMDMDGHWADNDQNGRYDSHLGGTGDVAPDIWFGRITTSPLGDESSLVDDYLQKNHAYRSGELKFKKEALVYIDDDWRYSANYWDAAVQQVYPGATTLVDDPYTTNADDYKRRLAAENYESILQTIHSSPSLLQFKSPDAYSYVYTQEIPVLNPQIGYYNFFDCSFANYTRTDYMAGKYIFETDYGLAGVGSTKTGSMLRFDIFYDLLRDMTMGESLQEWLDILGVDGYELWERQWFYGMTLLGDPTIGPAKAPFSTSIPEPSTLVLLALGWGVLFGYLGRRCAGSA